MRTVDEVGELPDDDDASDDEEDDYTQSRCAFSFPALELAWDVVDRSAFSPSLLRLVACFSFASLAS